MKTASIYDSSAFNENRPAIKVLFETSFTKEIRIALKQRQEMKEHKTAVPIVIRIVEGSIDFGLPAQRVRLEKGDLIALDENIPHDLLALEESIVRLSLTMLDSPDRVKSVAK